MIELVNVVYDFIANYSIELLAACFTILAAAIPIPVMFKKILEELNQANKIKAELEDAKKKLKELTSNKNEAEDEAQDDTESIGISLQSPKHAFFTYSSKKITLN